MQIVIFGEQSDPALMHHLRDRVNLALEKYTNYVDKVSLYWKSETLEDRATQYGCCLHLRFFNHQTAETTYWDEDLSEATRRSADLAARLAERCCVPMKKRVASA